MRKNSCNCVKSELMRIDDGSDHGLERNKRKLFSKARGTLAMNNNVNRQQTK